MGRKRDSNPFNGPKWENCWNRDLFGHLKVKFLFFVFFYQWTSQLSIMSWISHMSYFVGSRMKLAEADWLKGISKTQQLLVVKPSLPLDLRRKFEMLSSRLCMDFVWTPRLLLLPYLHPWTTGQLLKPTVCEGCACQPHQCVFLHTSVQ